MRGEGRKATIQFVVALELNLKQQKPAGIKGHCDQFAGFIVTGLAIQFTFHPYKSRWNIAARMAAIQPRTNRLCSLTGAKIRNTV